MPLNVTVLNSAICWPEGQEADDADNDEDDNNVEASAC